MGSHYSSIQIRTDDWLQVKAAVEIVAKDLGKKFLIAPVLDGWIGVYPDDSGNDERCAAILAKALAKDVIQLIIHDSDVFYYNLFRGGELINEYSSDPDYFESASPQEHERLRAKPELFRDFVKDAEVVEKLGGLLRRGSGERHFDFAEERLERFANFLGIRNTQTSYTYITEGEHDGVKGWKEFVHVPDLSEEKRVKKEAALALQRQKQKLQHEGYLHLELLPKGKKRQLALARPWVAANPVSGGFIATWTHQQQLIQIPSSLKSAPENILLPFEGTWGEPCLSPNGAWLAFWNQGAKLLDLTNRSLVDGFQFLGVPGRFAPKGDFLVCRWDNRLDILEVPSGRNIRTVSCDIRSLHRSAIHPDGEYMVATPRDDRIAIINLRLGKIEKVLLSGGKVNYSRIMSLTQSIVDHLRDKELAQWKDSFIQGPAHVLNLCFSGDGKWLFCATTLGLRVLSWADTFAAAETTPPPVFTMTPNPSINPIVMSDDSSSNYVYDVVEDGSTNRVLFAGMQGIIRYLNLNDGSHGVLLDPPGKTPINQIALSQDRESLAIACLPADRHASHEPWRMQVWNYRKLCEAADLAF